MSNVSIPFESDGDLFELLRRELFTAVIGDVLDEMGYRHQFLPPQIRPLAPAMRLVGRAMTVVEADVFDDSKPFGLMFKALDDLKPHEVYLATGGSPRYAMFGELMSIAAQKRGAAGVVIDGMIRDTEGIIRQGFPSFCTGSYAQDQKYRGRVIDFRVPVEVGAATVNPGDILYGDVDGVLVIPQAAEREAITKALDKVRGEQEVRRALEHGMSAAEAFAKYGIL